MDIPQWFILSFMPSAPQIRKALLQRLDEQIIPALQTQIVSQVLLDHSLDYSAFEHHIIRDKPLVNRTLKPLDMRVQWKNEHLMARRMSQLSFICQGSSQERIGLTRQMAHQFAASGRVIPPGIVAIRLTAPAAFYVPPHVPHSDMLPREIVRQESESLQMLVVQSDERDFFIRLVDEQSATHSLQIFDPSLTIAKESYIGSLLEGDAKTMQAHLLYFMRLLSSYLHSQYVDVCNTAWPAFDRQLFKHKLTSQLKAQLCYRAIDYIQLHLHSALSGTDIASVCNVSYAYLNRTFQEVVGVSVMRFVTQARLSAAKRMLSETNERIGDVANLVGFSSIHTFSTVFLRHTGVSPRRYRRMASTHLSK